MDSTIVQSIPEYKIISGDPRSIFYNFISKYSNVDKAGKLPGVTLINKCSKNNKRMIKLKNKESIQSIKSILENQSSKPFVIFFILTKQFNCEVNNKVSHSTVGIYNKINKEFTLLDPRAFITKFRKISINNISKAIKLEKLNFIDIKDIDENFIFNLNLSYINDAYPIWLFGFLELWLNNPNWTINKAINEANSMDVNFARDQFIKYSDFHMKKTTSCDIGKIYKPETKHCIKIENAQLTIPLHKNRKRSFSIGRKQLEKYSLRKNKLDTKLADEDRDLAEIVYFLKMFPNACSILPTNKRKSWSFDSEELNIIWDWNNKKNKWNLTIPSLLWSTFDSCMKKNNIRFIFFYIHLAKKDYSTSHANILLYDKSTNEFERFDPNGIWMPDEDWGWIELDNQLKELIIKEHKTHIPNGWNYFGPIDFCPRKDLFQLDEVDEVLLDRTGGHCAIWTFWYLYTRLSNPSFNRKQVINEAMYLLKKEGSLAKFIRKWELFVIDKVKEITSHKYTDVISKLDRKRSRSRSRSKSRKRSSRRSNRRSVRRSKRSNRRR